MNRLRPLPRGARKVLADEGGSWSGDELAAAISRSRRVVQRTSGRRIGIATRSARALVALAVAALLEEREPVLVDPGGVPGDGGPGDLPVDVVLTDPEAGDGEDPGTGKDGGVVPCGDHRATLAFLTSGSTGRPKVVPKRLGQLSVQMEHEVPVLGVPRGCRVVSLVPPFHILGFLYGIVLPFLRDGSTFFARREAPFAWLEVLRTAEPRLVVGVPFHYRILAEIADGDLPPAVYLSSGGPLPPKVDEAFTRRTGRPILQVYGSTETGGIATRRGQEPWSALPGLEWKVDHATGHLLVKSPWQDRPVEWCWTDDLAVPDHDGFQLKGRSDSIVKIGGRRVSTETVRRAVLEIPAVREAVVLPYERRGETGLALFVEGVAGAQGLDADTVRGWLARELGPALVPRTVRVVRELPRLETGKVDRRGLLRTLPRGGE